MGRPRGNPDDDRFVFGGGSTVTPVVGNWDGVGPDEVGVFRNGTWFLDLNGNDQWDGPGGLPNDVRFVFGGGPTDTPVVSNWDGVGPDEVGVFRNGNWFLDLNGNDKWDGLGGLDPDVRFRFGGPTDTPVRGRW